MVSDGTVAIFIGIIMFLMPSEIPGLTQDPGKYMDWSRKKPSRQPLFSGVKCTFDYAWQE